MVWRKAVIEGGRGLEEGVLCRKAVIEGERRLEEWIARDI